MTKYMLFDTETTGGAEEDRIIQFGLMILEGKSIDVYNDFCSAPLPIKIEAMEVHNITEEMIADKPLATDTQAYRKLLENNHNDNYLIAHNLPFDLGMIKKEGFEEQYTLIDTLRVARHLLTEQPSHRLQYLRYALGLYKEEQSEAQKLGITIKAHDAIGDVLVMKLLMSHLVVVAKEQYPDENPMQLFADLTKKPVLVKTFKFGKYKGRQIQEVAQEDSGYLKWMFDNLDLDSDLRYTLTQYL
jgi:exodeoxyribonuclease X